VLPLFALSNAGVAISSDVFDGRGRLMAAIALGLVVGKPLGILALSGIAVALKLAIKPTDYSWLQLAGAGLLGGIGFTMSLFIGGEAFAAEADFEAAKIAVLAASVVAAALGVLTLESSSRAGD
jgi:NhaA family Na+:H+ antiporter